MRILLTILFLILLRMASAQVVISDDVARYFLESHDKLKIHEEKDSLDHQLIESLRVTIDTKDLYIFHLNNSNKTLTTVIETKDREILFKEEEITQLKKTVKKERLKSTLTTIGAGVLIILMVL